VGRPVVVSADKLDYARRLRDSGDTVAQVVAKTGIARTSLYRHLPPRAPDLLTASGRQPPSR
jgi:DNA-binding phage protein